MNFEEVKLFIFLYKLLFLDWLYIYVFIKKSHDLMILLSFQEIREIRAIGVDNMIIGTDVKGYLTHDNNNCCEIGLDRVYELPLTPEIVASLNNELMVLN